MADLLTADELAASLKVQPRTVREWTRQGMIPAIKLTPKVVRYDLEQVVDALRNEQGDRSRTISDLKDKAQRLGLHLTTADELEGTEDEV